MKSRFIATSGGVCLVLLLAAVPFATVYSSAHAPITDGSCEAGEESAMLQVKSSKMEQASSEEGASKADDSLPMPQIGLINNLLGGFFDDGSKEPPLKLAGTQCEVTILDCSDPAKRRACPQTCQAEEDFIGLLNGSTGIHIDAARDRMLARLQTVARKHAEESAANGKPINTENFHEAILAVDEGLQHLASKKDGSREDEFAPYNAGGEVTYALTVIEAYLVYWDLTGDWDLVKANTTAMRIFHDFALVCDKEGWNSDAAKVWYEASIFLTGCVIQPGDAGWLNVVIDNIRVIVENNNLHIYRKVPFSVRDPFNMGYDFDFGVYKLPDDKDLKIGVVADWGAGTNASLKVITEMKKQNVDMVLHLGDVYYSGTTYEAHQFIKDPIRAVFGEKMPFYNVPGNHDYYSGGQGFYEVIDELGLQEASFFCLRGKHFQILALDTGILDTFALLFSLGETKKVRDANQHTLSFVPDDQFAWARHQLEVGKKMGLRTIMMSHHQLFSRYSMGVPNSWLNEQLTMPDRQAGVFETSEFEKKSHDLPGHLPPEAQPTVNTRLLSQFPPEVLEDVAAWFWGHEHAALVFEPYAGLQRGRCIGNSAIGNPRSYDYFGKDDTMHGEPWGGFPEVIPGSEISPGMDFWGFGFITLTLSGKNVTADYFQLLDSRVPPGSSTWGDATKYFSETFQ